MPEAVQLTIALVPDRGRIALIAFGYNELQRQVDQQVDYIARRIKQEYPKVDTTPESVRGQIMRIWGWFQPALPSTPGGFTLKVPGEIGEASQPAPPPPDLSGELAAERAAHALANAQLKQVTAALERVTGERDKALADLYTQQRENRRALDRVREAEQAMAMLEAEATRLQTERSAANERERRLKGDVDGLKKQLKNREDELTGLSERLATAEQSADRLNAQVDELQAELKQSSRPEIIEPVELPPLAGQTILPRPFEG